MDTIQITQQFADRAGIDSKDAAKMIETLAATIAEACCNLDTVAVPGFGNFSATKHEEYIKEDHDSDQRILMPPVIEPEFRTSVILRNRLSK